MRCRAALSVDEMGNSLHPDRLDSPFQERTDAMAQDRSNQPVNPRGLQIPGDPSSTGGPAPNADPRRSDDAPTGISERLQAEKEGRHPKTTTPDGKPYADTMDPDGHEKGSATIGTPGGAV